MRQTNAATPNRSQRRKLFLILIEERLQIGNEAVDFAQIFAATFLRAKPALPHHDRKIPDPMKLFPREFFRRGKFVQGGGRGE